MTRSRPVLRCELCTAQPAGLRFIEPAHGQDLDEAANAHARECHHDAMLANADEVLGFMKVTR